MPETETDLLVKYVGENTPEDAPPFDHLIAAVRRRRRARRLVIAAAVVGLVAGAGAVSAFDAQRAKELPVAPPVTTPTPASEPTRTLLLEGPPPEQFKSGSTVLVLAGEIKVITVRRDASNASRLLVDAERGDSETCQPHALARVLAQTPTTVRIAAYRYTVASGQPEAPQCLNPERGPIQLSLDIRSPLADRTVLAGSKGNRILIMN